MTKKNKQKTDWKALLLQMMVVFLGVTMGFVLNNYSGSKKNEQKELQYKKALLNDIDINIRELNKMIESDKNWIVEAGNILNHLEKSPKSRIDSLEQIFKLTTTINDMFVQKSAFESLKSSGDINLITDVNLKKELIKYYSGSVYKMEFGEEYLKNFFNQNIVPFAIKTYDRYSGKFLNPERDATQYLNNLISFYRAKEQVVTQYQNTLAHSNYLKTELEK